jgi:drug/metabolite transporter (DMT)-like permease
MPPQWLAGLLYLGSGLGLGIWMILRKSILHRRPVEAGLQRADWPWLAGAILSGGLVAPVLLVIGLVGTMASTASLLLNLEGVFTALLAWFVFRENFDRRIFIGMIAIVTGSVVLSWKGSAGGGVPWSALCIAGACLGWALDNNLTRTVSAADPVQTTMIKGLVAGSINSAIAWELTRQVPSVMSVLAAGMVGLFGYGISLTLFVLALRHLGTARTGAYFSTAPFVGAALSFLLLAETPGWVFWVAGALMAFGVWLHLSERHEHQHRHPALSHTHRHVHDEHHQHVHLPSDPPGEPHSHRHVHKALVHVHPHVPDIHHQHDHQE